MILKTWFPALAVDVLDRCPLATLGQSIRPKYDFLSVFIDISSHELRNADIECRVSNYYPVFSTVICSTLIAKKERILGLSERNLSYNLIDNLRDSIVLLPRICPSN